MSSPFNMTLGLPPFYCMRILQGLGADEKALWKIPAWSKTPSFHVSKRVFMSFCEWIVWIIQRVKIVRKTI